MSEHIIETEICAGTPFVPIGGAGKLREEIVRCRDCKHMHTVKDWCWGVDVDECWLHADHESGALGKEPTEPNGFCAWGERKGSA